MNIFYRVHSQNPISPSWIGKGICNKIERNMSMISPKREQKKWAMLVNNGMKRAGWGWIKSFAAILPTTRTENAHIYCKWINHQQKKTANLYPISRPNRRFIINLLGSCNFHIAKLIFYVCYKNRLDTTVWTWREKAKNNNSFFKKINIIFELKINLYKTRMVWEGPPLV